MSNIADYTGPDADNNVYVVSGNNLLGSVAITTALLPVSGPTQIYGMGSGTTSWVPIMTLSGAAGAPQPLVTNTSVSIDAAFINSGNIYIQSGVNWTGVGSVFSAGGSVNINNPQLIGSLAIQTVTGSIVATNLAGSVTIINDTFTRSGAMIVSGATASILIQPNTGSAVRLYYFGYSAHANNTGQVEVTLYNGSGVIDRQSLSATQSFVRNIGAGRKYYQLSTGSPLRCQFAGPATGSLFVNTEYDLIVP